MKNKIRVYELARKLDMSNKDLVALLKELGVEVKTHMSSVDSKAVQKVEKALSEATSEKQDPLEEKAPSPEKKGCDVHENDSIKKVAERLGVPGTEAVKALMDAGLMLSATAEVTPKALEVLEKAFKVKFTLLPAEERPQKKPSGSEKAVRQKKDDKKKPSEGKPVSVERSPIVTVMGHVDHGKTTLLDYIRKSNVSEREAGGITQHIGAYVVKHDKKSIVFLDTPGHEAFTAMRARGASVTDIVILVVAADDGVMPQTREAIDHIKAADVPIVVAINKVDKPTAKVDRVKQQLSDAGLVPEEWGGDVVMVDVSAKSGQGIPQLLEMVLLVAEMQELKGNPSASPAGVVIEAQLDKGKGPVATVIVQQGTLKRGDIVLFTSTWGKVRALLDSKGQRVKKAGPSTPVEILGLDEVPQPGEIFKVVSSEREARGAISENRSRERDSGALMRRASFEDLYAQMQAGNIPQLNLVVKCDVQGSVEALCASLEKLETHEVGVSIIHRGVGRISESDVMLASASNAVIIGFSVRPDVNAKKVAESDGIEIRTYDVIYDVIDDAKAALSGLLKPTLHEERLGEVEIRELFKVPKAGKIAGCHVLQGLVRRNSRVRVVRDGIVIWDGRIATLRHFKDEVREIKAGYDCGIALEGFQDFEEGDVLEVYEVIEKKRTL